MKILLCCKAGVTSNMFAAKLKDEASQKGIDVTVWAAAETAVEYSIDQADIVLVTPQLKSSLSKFDEDFTQFNAKKVLDEALAKND